MNSEKFLFLDKLAEVIALERKNNKIIALANGGFDLIHIGHLNYLYGAKKITDILIVALNSDISLKKLKGNDRPIIKQEGRIRLLSSLECVDYITLFEESTVDRILLTLKPDLHCKGGDYTVENVPERETVASYGGKTVIVGGEKVRSTSGIMKSLQQKSNPG